MAPRECPTASACPAQPGMGIIALFSWRKTEEILAPPFCPPQAAIHYPFSLKILLHLDIFMLISDGGSTGRSEEEKGKETPNNHGWWLRSAAEPRHCSGILDSAPPPVSSAVTFRPSGASQLRGGGVCCPESTLTALGGVGICRELCGVQECSPFPAAPG